MLKKVLAVASIAGALTGGAAMLATPALAGGEACYSVTVVVNGETTVDQAGCQPIG